MARLHSSELASCALCTSFVCVFVGLFPISASTFVLFQRAYLSLCSFVLPLCLQKPVLLVPARPYPMFHLQPPPFVFSVLQMPVLLMPAGDDPDNVKPGGDVASLVEGKGGASVVFPDMKHGW